MVITRNATSTRRIIAAVVASVCLSLIAGACASGDAKRASASPTRTVPAAQLSIKPADGASNDLAERASYVHCFQPGP